MSEERKQNIINTITLFEKNLERYKEDLQKTPNSSFYQGLVKNTTEYIDELKERIKD